MSPIETADETIPLLPDTPEGAAIRAAFLADERAVLVALAAQLTQTDAETRAKAKDLGVTACLEKPLDLEKLQRVLDEAVQNNRALPM